MSEPSGAPGAAAGQLGFCQLCGTEIGHGQSCVTLRMNTERIKAITAADAPRRIETTVVDSETVALLCTGCGDGLDGFWLRHLLDTHHPPERRPQ